MQIWRAHAVSSMLLVLVCAGSRASTTDTLVHAVSVGTTRTLIGAPAQGKTIDVTGAVLDSAGRPVAGADVKLRFSNVPPNCAGIMTTTDAGGHWYAKLPERTLDTISMMQPPYVAGTIRHAEYSPYYVGAPSPAFMAKPVMLRPPFPLRVRLVPTSGTRARQELEQIIARTPYQLHLGLEEPTYYFNGRGEIRVANVPRGVAMKPSFTPPSQPPKRVPQVVEWFVDGKLAATGSFTLPLESTPDVELRLWVGAATDIELAGDCPLQVRVINDLNGQPLANVDVGSSPRGFKQEGTTVTDERGMAEVLLKPENMADFGLAVFSPHRIVEAAYGTILEQFPSTLTFDSLDLKRARQERRRSQPLELRVVPITRGQARAHLQDAMGHPLQGGFAIVDEQHRWPLRVGSTEIELQQLQPGWQNYHVVNEAGVRQRFELVDQGAEAFRVVQAADHTTLQISWNNEFIGEPIILRLRDYLTPPPDAE